MVLGGLNTLVLIGSSVALQLGLFAVRRGKLRALAGLVAAAAVLGLAFLLLQLVSWQRLWDSGMTADQRHAGGEPAAASGSGRAASG